VSSEATPEELKDKISALSDASMKIGQAIYSKTSGSTDSATPPPEGGATDAEYEEKKDKKTDEKK
jgi:hypothetical protein